MTELDSYEEIHSNYDKLQRIALNFKKKVRHFEQKYQ